MSSLWDSVPDVHLDGRTILPFPDPDPEFTRGVWERLHAERDALRGAKEPESDEDLEVYKNHEAPVITHEAEEFDEPISALATYVKDAHKSGWDIAELAHAECTARGKVIKTGERAGSRHPDREIETQWLKIEKQGIGRAVISYTIINGKSNSVYRSFNGLSRSDKDMKGIIKK